MSSRYPTPIQPSIPVLIDAATIEARVQALGEQIAADYAGRELLVVPVLVGSFIFAADLLRTLGPGVRVDLLGVRSYGDDVETSGVVEITHDLRHPIEGLDVLVVEDIVDTGLTMSYLMRNLATRSPRSIRLAALLHKPARTRVPVPIDYLGFTIDDVFVVGYGLDHAGLYRNLPYLGVLPTGSE